LLAIASPGVAAVADPLAAGALAVVVTAGPAVVDEELASVSGGVVVLVTVVVVVVLVMEVVVVAVVVVVVVAVVVVGRTWHVPLASDVAFISPWPVGQVGCSAHTYPFTPRPALCGIAAWYRHQHSSCQLSATAKQSM